MRKVILPLLVCIISACVFISSCADSDSDFDTHINNGKAIDTQIMNEAENDIDNTSLEVHFIDVGQADASLVICDGKTMLIDGGNKADSRLMYSYLESHDINYLDYVVATHVHEDHIGGLAGALNYADFGTVYCNTSEHESDLFCDLKKQVEKAGKHIQVPNAGDNFDLGSAQVTIISCMESENENNSSVVLKIAYGKTSFLFTGDIEKEAEETIVRSGADIKATVLKVAHHGSENSTLYPFLVSAYPEYAVISTGKNDYGHPSQDTLRRLKIVEAECYRTDVHGDIVCSSDGENVEFSFSKNNPKR